MKTLAIWNKKGGVAKTTTTIHLSAYLAKRGFKVLAIDFDPQCNLSEGYGIDDYSYNVEKLLNGESGLKLKNKLKNLYILAGSETLNTKVYDLKLLKNRIETLAKIVKKNLSIDFDYVIIDCNPSDILDQTNDKGKVIPKLNQMAIYAADYIAIPLEAEEFSVNGLKKLVKNVIGFRDKYHSELTIAGVFFNKVLVNEIAFKDFYATVKESIPEKYFLNSYIRKDANIKKAVQNGDSIFNVAPKSRAAADYKALCKELLKKLN